MMSCVFAHVKQCLPLVEERFCAATTGSAIFISNHLMRSSFDYSTFPEFGPVFQQNDLLACPFFSEIRM